MDMDTIALCENAISDQGVSLVEAVLSSGRWGDGPMLESFEQGFARWIGRQHAVAVGSGTLGTWITLRAMGIGPGDEVICTSHTWHQVAQAITLAGATPVFADINYWSGCLSAEKAALKITPATKAILAGNTNGHPAAWKPLRELADAHCLKLIEDSTESLGSRYLGHISKRGDRYLRMLLTHGARSVLRAAAVAQGKGREVHGVRHWALQVQGRSNHNKAAYALANNLARICYATLRDKERFDETQSLSKKINRQAFAIPA